MNVPSISDVISDVRADDGASVAPQSESEDGIEQSESTADDSLASQTAVCTRDDMTFDSGSTHEAIEESDIPAIPPGMISIPDAVEFSTTDECVSTLLTTLLDDQEVDGSANEVENSGTEATAEVERDLPCVGPGNEAPHLHSTQLLLVEEGVKRPLYRRPTVV